MEGSRKPYNEANLHVKVSLKSIVGHSWKSYTRCHMAALIRAARPHQQSDVTQRLVEAVGAGSDGPRARPLDLVEHATVVAHVPRRPTRQNELSEASLEIAGEVPLGIAALLPRAGALPLVNGRNCFLIGRSGHSLTPTSKLPSDGILTPRSFT